jgi:gas vesicle protein
MKTTLGLLTGIAIGIGIGMLLAPDKGSETRKKLTDTASDLFEKLKGFVNRSEEEEKGTSRKKPQASRT